MCPEPLANQPSGEILDFGRLPTGEQRRGERIWVYVTLRPGLKLQKLAVGLKSSHGLDCKALIE